MEQEEATSPSSASILRRRAANGNNILSVPTNATSNNANGSGVSHNNRNNIDAIESIIHEYTTACQIYGCADRINPGILTTFRF